MDLNRLHALLATVEKPARYTDDEYNTVHKTHTPDKVKILLAFPDLYEVGMSYLGFKILYHIINERPDALAERVFAPAMDMAEALKKEGWPLFALESKAPVGDFDLVGFTLQYEMSYSNILYMLDLAGIPLQSKDRKEGGPFIIAGGPGAFNPEPLSPFLDFFVIGEGEEVILELIEKYKKWRDKQAGRTTFLEDVAELEGIYVPQFYEPQYREGKYQGLKPLTGKARPEIRKRLVYDLDAAPYPTRPVVPYINIVHDRAALELFRGCTRGCRYCQAGMIYRPVRERSRNTLHEQARDLITQTGYDELSLTSLSSMDYSDLLHLVRELDQDLSGQGVKLSFPSLRVDSFSIDVAEGISGRKKGSITLAPEAGTQRLRDVINKGVSEEDILAACRKAFQAGWNSLKLYFMIGLPTETYEDLDGIVELVEAIGEVYRELKQNTSHLRVTVSTSCFVPKPHTPFQFVGQLEVAELKRRQKYPAERLTRKWMEYNWDDAELSLLEAAFSRGDRRLARVLLSAYRRGAKFDGWADHFDYDAWQEAFAENSLTPEEFAQAVYRKDDVLPFDHIKPGLSKGFLHREYERALRGEVTPDCRGGKCPGCGVCPAFSAKTVLYGKRPLGVKSK